MSAFARAVAAQAASLLLRYPDPQALGALPTLRAALAGLPGALAKPLELLATHRSGNPSTLAIEYVELFDHRARHCLHLTYYTAGDTRNRGAQLIEFANAYREAGYEPADGELPDFLPAVLELAAQAGEKPWALLGRYRVGLDLLGDALRREQSPYWHAIAAVLALLPAAGARDIAAAAELAKSGPPREAVGLQPFTLTTGGRL